MRAPRNLSRAAALLALSWALGSLASLAVWAAPPANNARGLEAAPAMNYMGVDQVNLFNGGLSMTIPLGPRFPLGPGSSYGFTLIYSSQLWDGGREGTQNQWLIEPSKLFNAGLGWRVSLGTLLPANDRATGFAGWVFIGPDGSQHKFRDRLNDLDTPEPGVQYSFNGSYVRFNVDLRQVETPDGMKYQFDGLSQGYRLLWIEDAFGYRVTLDYSQLAALGQVTVFDYQGRLHVMSFNTGAWEGGFYGLHGVLKDLRLSNGTGADDHWTFDYQRALTTRGCPHVGTSQYPLLVNAPFLTQVTQPDGTAWKWDLAAGAYQTSQAATCTLHSGLVRKMTLPTYGEIQWDWGVVSWVAQDPTRCQDYAYATAAVAKRRLVAYPETNPTVPDGETEYRRAWQDTWSCDPTPPGPIPPDWSSTRVIERTKSGGQLLVMRDSEHFFELRLDAGYGLPGRHDVSAGQGMLSSTVKDGADSPRRSVYTAYVYQNGVGNEPGNPLLAYQREVFEDDKVGGEPSYREQSWGDPDGLGHFRFSSTGNNFTNQLLAELGSLPAGLAAAASRISESEYYPRPAANQPWILSRMRSVKVTEGGSSQKSEACYDPDGFLRWRRDYASGSSAGANDVLVSYERSIGSFVTKEQYYGASANPLTGLVTDPATCALTGLPGTNTYERRHTYTAGALATTTEHEANGNALPYRIVERTIDPLSGLATSSKDVAGISTTYHYDAFGRLREVVPAAGEARTLVRYEIGSVSPPQNPGIETVRQHDGVDLETSRQEIDRFGRVFSRRRLMPRGAGGTEYSVVNTDTNTLGWVTKQSAPRWAGDPRKDTTYQDFDPFGRPGKIVPPEGSAHAATISYWGQRRIRRTRIVGLEVGTGGALVETPVTDEELYDSEGRLVMVRENVTTGNQATATTTYRYDVGGRLVSVTQQTVSGTQTPRSFTYNSLGFLLSESHPEKGGTVTYGGYDALGRVGTKTDGGVTLAYKWDRGGRLTEVREGTLSGRLLKQFEFGTANGSGNYPRGKLVTATRYHYVDTAIPPAAPNEETFSVVERFSYFGLGGRLSNRRTEGTMSGAPILEPFDVGYVYEPTGRVQLTYYPRCGGGCSLGVGYEQGMFATAFAVAFPFPGSPETIESWTEQFRFHPTGGLAEILRSNQTVDTFALDPTNPTRPQSFLTKLGPTTKWTSGTYGYDGAGNVTAIGGSTFRYDPQSRLTLANVRTTPLGTDGGQQQRFVYDGFGNLQEIQGAQGLATPTNSATNRLSAPMAAYDSRGNLTGWGGAEYRWDPFNLMARMRTSTEDWIYLYTADDERVVARKAAGFPVNRWTIRGVDNKVLSAFREEEPAPGQTVWFTEARYFYHGSQLISAITPEGVRHYHLDHLGSPRLVTDASGNQVAFHTYFPYGGEATPQNQDYEPMKFTGHERDLNSIGGIGDDLDYMHARFHSPVVGRFLSVDSFPPYAARPQEWNRYSYVTGNPITLVDPFGLFSTTFPLILFDLCYSRGLCSDETITVKASTSSSSSTSGLAGLSELVQGAGLLGGLRDLARSTVESIAAFRAENTRRIDNLLCIRAVTDATAPCRDDSIPAPMFFGVGPMAMRPSSGLAVTFGHGARHLTGTGLSQEAVETAISTQITAEAAGASTTGAFWGKVAVEGRIIIYRAYTVLKDRIHVGTYYMSRQ